MKDIVAYRLRKRDYLRKRRLNPEFLKREAEIARRYRARRSDERRALDKLRDLKRSMLPYRVAFRKARVAQERAATIGSRAAIRKIYKRAKVLRQWFKVDVDHIIPIPLGGKHSAKNLQIIYHFENVAKGRRLDYVPRVIFK